MVNDTFDKNWNESMDILRERLAMLFFAVDYEDIKEPLPFIQGRWDAFKYRIENDSPWSNGNHMGDCNNQPNSCMRCVLEECYQQANDVMNSLGYYSITK